MQRRFLTLAGIGSVVLAAAALAGADRVGLTVRDKAYFASEAQVNFVRPGLVMQIIGAAVAPDGTATAQFKVTDPKGMPLDRLGVTTPGAISTTFILAYIPRGQKQHVAYTVRAQKSPINGVTAMQAGSDSGGTYTDNGNGIYTYTFNTKVPKTYEPGSTHTVGLYGSRNLTEFDMGTDYADAVYNFVPDGSKVAVTRDVVKTAACNGCHDQVGFHGGPRKSVELCVLCHQPQSIDPDTGNTVDMAVFIHKIHRGSSLPSVVAGKPYQIIGHSQTVADYSEVNFPADVRSCTKCHDAVPGAAQANAYMTPNRTACGSCHDNVNFASGLNHVNLPQTSDSQCGNCHANKPNADFDPSIPGAHLIPRFSQNLPGVVFELLGASGKPGQPVTVTFTIKDKKGNAVALTDLTRLNILLTGPNTDFALPGVTAGYVTESGLTKAVGDGKGGFTYTFAAKLPATATGSYTVAIEGRREVKLMPGTVKEILVRDTGKNKQLAFSVDSSPAKARRVIVSTAKCDACHGSLAMHGDNRNEVAQCAICHNAALTAGTASVDFKTMVHRIHRGTALTRPYQLGTTSFNEVGYPGDLRDCNACHVNNSQQLPLQEGIMPVNDPSGFITSVPATTAACTSCHDQKSATAHALANTSQTQGESCDICHGPSANASVDRVHAK